VSPYAVVMPSSRISGLAAQGSAKHRPMSSRFGVQNYECVSPSRVPRTGSARRPSADNQPDTKANATIARKNRKSIRTLNGFAHGLQPRSGPTPHKAVGFRDIAAAVRPDPHRDLHAVILGQQARIGKSGEEPSTTFSAWVAPLPSGEL